MTAAPSMFPHFPGAGGPREHYESSAGRFDIDTMVKALGGKRTGAQAMVCCPVHNDRNPSLSITMKDGKPLAHCFAGCPQADVIAALRSRGLWPDRPMWKRYQLAVDVGDVDPKLGKIIATYDYADMHGEVLYRVCRFEPKCFRPRIVGPNGEWIAKGPADDQKVLYRLSEVREAPIVFVVEGERDAETLREYGFVATTTIFGANKPWLPQYIEALREREVILIGDNDAAGRTHMAKVRRALYGNVAKLIEIELDDRVKDVTEWFERGHSELELIELVEHPEEGVSQ